MVHFNAYDTPILHFSPNPGFMFQLHLFEAMGQTVDKSNSLYKQYKLQIVARQLRETGVFNVKMICRVYEKVDL